MVKKKIKFIEKIISKINKKIDFYLKIYINELINEFKIWTSNLFLGVKKKFIFDI